MEATGTVERASELAREGDCRTIEEVRHRLVVEQYSSIEQHLGSRILRKQLAALMAARREEPGG